MMDKLDFEIKRIEDFYNSFKSTNNFFWMKDYGLLLYEERLTKLYTEKGIPSKLKALS